jgi:hypothetical protein
MSSGATGLPAGLRAGGPAAAPQHVIAPAPLARRDVLAGTGFGIASLVLPAATAAASEQFFGPQAFAYAATDRTVAAWLPFDSEASATYAGSGVLAKRFSTGGLSAFMTQAGSTTSLGTARASLTDPGISGLSMDATFSEWAMRNSATTPDLVNAPHLRFTISVVSGTLTLSTLVLHSVRNELAADVSDSDVSLVAYVTATGVADGAAVLRRTATLRVADGYRHIVIDLGLTGTTFVAGGTVVVRLYPYATSVARVVRFARFDSSPAPVALTAADTIDESRSNGNLERSGTGEGGDGATAPWMAAFVGTYT